MKFKSYLLSLGIDDPVTRDACSSGDSYRNQLAKQIADFLLSPISVTQKGIIFHAFTNYFITAIRWPHGVARRLLSNKSRSRT